MEYIVASEVASTDNCQITQGSHPIAVPYIKVPFHGVARRSLLAK